MGGETIVLYQLRWLPRVITNIVLTERELENETLSTPQSFYQYGYC